MTKLCSDNRMDLSIQDFCPPLVHAKRDFSPGGLCGQSKRLKKVENFLSQSKYDIDGPGTPAAAAADGGPPSFFYDHHHHHHRHPHSSIIIPHHHDDKKSKKMSEEGIRVGLRQVHRRRKVGVRARISF